MNTDEMRELWRREVGIIDDRGPAEHDPIIDPYLTANQEASSAQFSSYLGMIKNKFPEGAESFLKSEIGPQLYELHINHHEKVELIIDAIKQIAPKGDIAKVDNKHAFPHKLLEIVKECISNSFSKEGITEIVGRSQRTHLLTREKEGVDIVKFKQELKEWNVQSQKMASASEAAASPASSTAGPGSRSPSVSEESRHSSRTPSPEPNPKSPAVTRWAAAEIARNAQENQQHQL